MSDLIEQLGGYENSKNFLNESNGKDWNGVFYMPKLKQSLLEYRREHKIFEVGDKVVFIDSELKNPRLMTVIEVSEPVCGFLMAECSWGITNGFYPSRYRHATDAEIEAGHRL